MKWYEVSVKVSGIWVRTQLRAQSNQDALLLLKAQFGSGNVDSSSITKK
jgi:hypothetical protein